MGQKFCSTEMPSTPEYEAIQHYTNDKLAGFAPLRLTERSSLRPGGRVHRRHRHLLRIESRVPSLKPSDGSKVLQHRDAVDARVRGDPALHERQVGRVRAFAREDESIADTVTFCVSSRGYRR
jgi:hypothetical protein